MATAKQALADYLRYLQECGEHTIELDKETAEIFRASAAQKKSAANPISAPPKQAAPRAVAADFSAKPSATPRAAEKSPPPVAADFSAMQENFQAATAKTLDQIAAEISACRRCVLCKERNNVVPGQGNANSPDLMFVGEAPGADEDASGLAFVGRAGQLLTKMIEAMGYKREEVFIANICKCRPPNNRTPAADEMASCIAFLQQQIAIIRPRIIVSLGNTALLGLTGRTGITQVHGRWQKYEGALMMPTYHPAYLLRFPSLKKDTWVDLQKVMAKIKELKAS